MEVSRSELRRSRHEREQAAMREAGIDPSAASAIGHTERATDGGIFFATTWKGVRNSRRRRELTAAAELGVEAPADFDSLSIARTSSNASQSSIRRSRLRREHEAIQKLEREQRQREREEQALERATARAHAKAKREHLKRARELEGLSGNPGSMWRRLVCFCHQARPAYDADAGEPLKQQDLYDV